MSQSQKHLMELANHTLICFLPHGSLSYSVFFVGWSINFIFTLMTITFIPPTQTAESTRFPMCTYMSNLRPILTQLVHSQAFFVSVKNLGISTSCSFALISAFNPALNLLVLVQNTSWNFISELHTWHESLKVLSIKAFLNIDKWKDPLYTTPLVPLRKQNCISELIAFYSLFFIC